MPDGIAPLVSGLSRTCAPVTPIRKIIVRSTPSFTEKFTRHVGGVGVPAEHPDRDAAPLPLRMRGPDLREPVLRRSPELLAVGAATQGGGHLHGLCSAATLGVPRTVGGVV